MLIRRAMSTKVGFPTWATLLLRCPRDGAVVTTATSSVVCACGWEAQIVNGVLDLLDLRGLDSTARSELAHRELEWGAEKIHLTGMQQAEVRSHLHAMALKPNQTVLELGCGAGRMTSHLQHAATRLLAVDFSMVGLERVARGVAPSAALVRADVTKLALAPQCADRILCTLISNLPNASARLTVYAAAAHALRSNGRFAFSAHFYSRRARLDGIAKVGDYAGSNLFREFQTSDEVREELSRYFADVRIQPIQIIPPFVRRLRLPQAPISRICERLPFLRDFGELLLVTAMQPRSAA